MATTSKLALRYPAPTDAPDGPGAFFNLATDIDNLQADGAVTFPGSIATAAGHSTTVRRIPGNVAVFSFALFLGVGFYTGTTPLLALLPTGYRPSASSSPVTLMVGLSGVAGGGWGGYGICEIRSDGGLYLNYLSGASPTGIYGTATFNL